MAEPQLIANVDGTIAKVREAQRAGIAKLDGRWFGGDAGVAGLRSLTPKIDEWASRGQAAAKSGKTPSANGWPGWVKAGEILIDGLEKIAEESLAAPLKIFGEVVSEAPATSAKFVEQVAKKTGKAAGEALSGVTSAVGAGVGNLIRPLILPIVLIALVAAGGLILKSRLTK
jgi:hypothetical protein